ncbi:MAG: pyruvate formate lyase family protein, partial [Desulfomonilaceae bacterium]
MLKFALECLDLMDDDLRPYPEVMELRDAYFRAVPEMCIERPSLITQYHRENKLLDQDRISVLQKAKAYRFLLKKRKAIVKHYVAPDKYDPEFDKFEFSDRSPFAGSTTGKFKGVLLYPELFGLVMWPELHTVSKRRPNPFVISEDDANKLNFDVFPHWINNTVWEKTRSTYYENQFHDPVTTDFPDQMKLFQNMVFFLVTKSICISHCIPNFKDVLEFGLAEMIEKSRKREAEETEESKIDFHKASIEIMTGIIEYSRNLATEASRLASVEKSAKERDRLKEISEIYNRVPESKPTTLREALTTIWVCWVALHQENPNIGLSLGRLDQLLHKFYKSDIHGMNDENIINYNKKAVELLCFFWLKIGDHVPTMLDAGEKLFGGTGSNQAVTIGGIDKDENDAVNELTYIILKAASLLKLRDPNLAARYHPEKNPAEYILKL